MRYHIHVANPPSAESNIIADVNGDNRIVLAPGQSKLFEIDQEGDDHEHAVNVSVTDEQPAEPEEGE